MTYYAAAAGVVLESDIPLPGLCPARGPAALSVARGAVQADSAEIDWIQRWIGDDGRAWLACGRAGGAYVLRFSGTADVLVDPGVRQIVWSPPPAAVPRTTRSDVDAMGTLLAGQVVPRVLSLDGTPVLHAAAVALDGEALVLAGESGAGKSTLAAALCAAGAELLADDFAVLQASGGGRVLCLPTSTCVNLAPASIALLGHGSRLPRSVRDCAPARPLRAIFLLDAAAGQDVVLEQVPGRDAFMRLFRLAYRLDSMAPSIVRAEFARLATVTATVPVQILRVPRGPQALAASVAAIRSFTRTPGSRKDRAADGPPGGSRRRARIGPHEQ